MSATDLPTNEKRKAETVLSGDAKRAATPAESGGGLSSVLLSTVPDIPKKEDAVDKKQGIVIRQIQ